MARIRIAGLVRIADHLRRELAQPMAPQKREDWRSRVTATLAKVDEMLAVHRVSVKDLPGPSQRAYHFLTTLDWGKIATMDGPAAPHQTSAHVTFGGLTSFLDRATRQLATTDTPQRLDQVHGSIKAASRRLEFGIARSAYRPEQLSETTREIRGWLAFFAERANLALYAKAYERGQVIVPATIKQRYRAPVILQFRPTSYLYKIQQGRLQTLVSLPTPMIAFDETGFRLVADLIGTRSRHAKQQLQQAMLSEEYQWVQAELESLAGIPEQSRGAYHDLGKAFDRVNERYFQGKMHRPRLAWNSVFTHRKFGHYDTIRDTIMVSSTLDQASVPEFLVDYLVYHELLHKRLGVRIQDGRRYAHTLEFRTLERQFERYQEAESILERLSTTPPGGHLNLGQQ